MAEAAVVAANWVGQAIGATLTAAGVSASVALPIAATAANIAYGVSIIALQAGLQYAIDAVNRPKLKPPGSELQFNIDPDYPREMIIGQRLVGGSMVARYSRGSNLYNAHLVIQLADHPCVELSKVYDGGRLVRSTPLTHGTRTEITAYSNSGGARVWMTWWDGRPGQVADSDLVTKSAQDPEVVAGKIEGWTSNHKGAGCAYVHVEVQWDSDILTSLPQFQFLVKGAKLYDRRKDTTAGGSGAHRHNDPATWEYSTNAMVAMDHFLLGYKVESDPLAFGIGLSKSEVPYAQFAAAADLCDEDVVTGVGGAAETIKRYAVNGVISAGDYFEEVVEAFQLQMAARVVDLGGRIGILGAEERAVVVSLTEDDLVAGEPLQFADKLQFTDLIGTVTGTFADPANNYQPTAYEPLVSAYAALPDGGEAQATSLVFPYEVHPRRVVRLATAWLERESLQPRLAGVFMPKAWKLEPGDWFEFTSPRLQVTAAKFEVVDIVKNEDFTVLITARAIDPNFLAFSNDNDPDLSVPPDVEPVARILDAPTFAATATTITGGGATEPVLQVVADPPNPVTRELVIEAREWNGTALTGPSILHIGHADDLTSILRQALKPNTAYKVRMKARAGARESAWSEWSAPVTTSSTYIVPAASSAAPGSDLDVDFSAAIAAAAAASASASAAAASATSSEAAKLAAQTAKTAAELARDNAQTSATNAASSASASAGSASSASTQATNAANSASAASASQVSARLAAASVFPSTFENQTIFTETINGLAPTPFSGSDSRFSSVSGEGIVYTTDGDAAAMGTLGLIRPVAGRTYKVTARVRVTVNPTVARTTDTWVGFYTMDASGIGITYSGTVNYYDIVAADGWRNLSHTVTGDTLLTLGALARPITLLNWNHGGAGAPGDSTGNYTTDSTMQVAYLKLEDITESQSAAGSASASATSASSAAASQSGAASSASAASASATNAATQASNASTSASAASTSAGNAAASASTAGTHASNAAASASTATSQASAASASASAASSSATLSATYAAGSQGSINSSATFADNANATGIPTNWFEWSNAAADGVRQTGIAPQPYAYQQAGRAGENGGIYQPMFGRFSAGWHVIEADVTLVSGALTGAGVLLNADPASVYTEYPLSFSTDPDVNGSVVGAGTTGTLYKFRKLVQVGLGATYNHIYAMSHYGAFGSITAANSIKFHRVAVRPASQAEIEARQAKLDLVTANANIATNASAIATETSARAAADTSLSARINVKTNRFPYPQPLNGTVPSGWYHTGLTIGTWQPLGGNFYFKPRPSGGSALTEYYFYDLEPTNTAWIDASNQYTLSAIGYGGAGVAGDRLRMRIELLDSGGTIIHASPFVLLNAYYPDTRPSTTTTYSGAGEYVRRRVVFEREWPSSGSYQDAVFNYIKFESGPVATAYTSEGATETLQAAVTTNASAIATETSARAAADTTLTASLGTTNANVSTNASAIATIQGAAAYWETVVSAGGGDLAAVRLKAGASGSYLELISTVLRLANVSNGAVIEVMRAISGEAYFSRPVSADGGGKRVTVGPGYGVSGSEVVLWFGADTVAPSSQSRTNGYFALGTDGKIYYGTTELTNPAVSVFTKSVAVGGFGTSGTTVHTIATIDVNDVPAGGFIKLLNAYLPVGSYTLSSGTTWDGQLIVTEQLQSGGTEYTLHTISVQLDTGLLGFTYEGGNDPGLIFPKPPNAQNVSGNCRYRLKLQRTSGSNNISTSPASGGFFQIERTPG